MRIKTLLLFALAASASTVMTASAQDSGWWIGGRVGYWHDKVDNVSTNSFALAPEFGYDFNSYYNGGGDGFGFNFKSSDLRFGFFYSF